MSNFRRLYIKGGTYFFTVVTHNRKPILCTNKSIARLKAAFKYTKSKLPFTINGLVILPDQIHCIWQLPENDYNFSKRWNSIKRYFSLDMEGVSNHRREKNIWQRRYWEQLIRNESELYHHLDYIHYNPVKHGYANKPHNWEYSTFKHYVKNGHYDENWGSDGEPSHIKNLYIE